MSRRIGAYLIDDLVAIVLILVLVAPSAADAYEEQPPQRVWAVSIGSSLLLSVLLQGLTGATIGKLILGSGW